MRRCNKNKRLKREIRGNMGKEERKERMKEYELKREEGRKSLQEERERWRAEKR